MLGIGVRFIHHALFDGTMFTLQYYVVDTIILLILGTLGYQLHAHQPDGDAVPLALRKGVAADLESQEPELSDVHHLRRFARESA